MYLRRDQTILSCTIDGMLVACCGQVDTVGIVFFLTSVVEQHKQQWQQQYQQRSLLYTVYHNATQGGQWEMAMSIFEQLGKSDDASLRPDLYTYNTLMTVFSNAGMLPRALQLLEEARAVGLSPDVVTYRREKKTKNINSQEDSLGGINTCSFRFSVCSLLLSHPPHPRIRRTRCPTPSFLYGARGLSA